MFYVIYGEDSAKIKAAIDSLPPKSKRLCQKSSYFDGVIIECDKVIVTCGNKQIIEAYGDKVLSDKPKTKKKAK